MADNDCSKEMQTYHASEVTLSKPQQDEMRTRRDAGRTRLQNGLALGEHPEPKEMVSQGSYAMRTMVQDATNDYDIDDGAYFAKADLVDKNKSALTPLQARERVRDALVWDGRLKIDATVKNNCVRQAYPQGYHIDIPVYRIVEVSDGNGGTTEEFELASGDAWVKSDARGVTKWYNGKVGELNSGATDGSQLRRVTKLTKDLARSRADWKSKTTSGITLTKLVLDQFVANDAGDDKALRETWKAIDTALKSSTRVEHPVQKGVNLAEAGDAEVTFFHSCLKDALKKLEVLDKDDCTYSQAFAAWDGVFNTTHFSETGDTAKGKAAIGVTTQTARRNDGGGRFG